MKFPLKIVSNFLAFHAFYLACYHKHWFFHVHHQWYGPRMENL